MLFLNCDQKQQKTRSSILSLVTVSCGRNSRGSQKKPKYLFLPHTTTKRFVVCFCLIVCWLGFFKQYFALEFRKQPSATCCTEKVICLRECVICKEKKSLFKKVEEHIQHIYVGTPQLSNIIFLQVNFFNVQSKACSFKG